MDLSGGHQTCFPWAEYQPALEIPQPIQALDLAGGGVIHCHPSAEAERAHEARVLDHLAQLAAPTVEPPRRLQGPIPPLPSRLRARMRSVIRKGNPPCPNSPAPI